MAPMLTSRPEAPGAVVEDVEAGDGCAAVPSMCTEVRRGGGWEGVRGEPRNWARLARRRDPKGSRGSGYVTMMCRRVLHPATGVCRVRGVWGVGA